MENKSSIIYLFVFLGLAFPMTAKCREAMKNYKNENTNYIQMSINISKEIIDVTDTKSCDIQSLPSRVPEEVPRYHVFRFDHTHEGDFMKSTSKCDRLTDKQRNSDCSEFDHIVTKEPMNFSRMLLISVESTLVTAL